MLQAKQTGENSDIVANTKFKSTLRSIAWLVETVARGAAGYLLLVNLTHVVSAGVGAYFAVTAGVIVIAHFVKAYK